jgi:predicted Fe-Mo cluster-binding NifX family protein
MKVAIPSDNQVTITKRTGESKGFMVYEIENNQIVNSEYRVNTQEEHDEDVEHSHLQIIDLLKDVDLLLVAAIGKYMKKDADNNSLKYQIIKEEKLNQIIENFIKSQNMEIEKMNGILSAIAKVMHPAIDLSLTQLGIVKDIDINDNKVEVVFAFPFPNIPIADQLINSVKEPVINLGAEFSYEVVIMTEEEKQEFLRLEASAWKGM